MNETRRQALQADIESIVLAEADVGSSLPEDPDVLLDLVEIADEATAICAGLQKSAVNQARRVGVSWADLGSRLGISRQAAQQRFAPGEGAPDAEGVRIVRGTHAFNEMAVLETEGKAGYHLVGFGPLTLTLQASSQPWEHQRITARDRGQLRAQMQEQGWTYVGSWFPFHYFKRPLG